MTTFYLWWTILHLQLSCADNIIYLHQHSKCCQCRSMRKLIRFTLNDTHNCHWGSLVALTILLMQDDKSFTLHWQSSSECSRECVSVHFDYKGSQYNKHRQRCMKVNILHLTVEYPNATSNRKTQICYLRLDPTGLPKPSITCGLTGADTGLAC